MVECRGSMPCNLKMTRRFNRGSSFMGVLRFLFLKNGAVSVVDKAGAHAFRVFDVAEGADLHAEQLVGRYVSGHEGGVLFFLESVDQGLGIVLLADGGDLHEVTTRGNRGHRVGRVGGWS